MLVQVTAEHIKRGKRGFYHECPVSLAVHDLGYEYVMTTWCLCRVNKKMMIGAETVEYSLPPEARDFVGKFDAGDNVKPIQFILGDRFGHGR